MRPDASEYDAADLATRPTLCTGQCCDLKIEIQTPPRRVWLCRVGGGVTVERLRNGRWTVDSGSCGEGRDS